MARYGATKTLAVSPTMDTNAYAVGDAVDDVQTFPRALEFGKTGYIQSVTVKDLAKQNGAFDILFFSAAVTSTITDNAALDLDDADLANYIGHVSISSGDYVSLNDNSVATKSNIALPIHTSIENGDVQAVIRANDAKTYGAADITFAVSFMLDVR